MRLLYINHVETECVTAKWNFSVIIHSSLWNQFIQFYPYYSIETDFCSDHQTSMLPNLIRSFSDTILLDLTVAQDTVDHSHFLVTLYSLVRTFPSTSLIPFARYLLLYLISKSQSSSRLTPTPLLSPQVVSSIPVALRTTHQLATSGYVSPNWPHFWAPVL